MALVLGPPAVGGLVRPGDPSTAFDTSNMVVLGQGTFGEVYKAVYRATGRAFAVKIAELKKDPDESRDAEQEIMILRSCSNPHVVGYLGTWFHEKHARLWMAIEYCACGSLADVMFLSLIHI